MKHPEGDFPYSTPDSVDGAPESTETGAEVNENNQNDAGSEWAAPQVPAEWQAPGSFSAPAASPVIASEWTEHASAPAVEAESAPFEAAESDSPEISDAEQSPQSDDSAQDHAGQPSESDSGDAEAASGSSATFPAPAEDGAVDGGSPDEGDSPEQDIPAVDPAALDAADVDTADVDAAETDAAQAEPGEPGEPGETSSDAATTDSAEPELPREDAVPAETVPSSPEVTEGDPRESTDPAPSSEAADSAEPAEQAAAAEPESADHEVTVAETLAAAHTPAVEPVAASTLDDTPLARELAEITRRRQALNAQSLPLPDAPRIFTVANQKGGVGKTTTTVNLAAALARGGARVLVIDLDPQGNASTALGVEHRADTVSVYDVIINDEPMAEVVQKSPEFAGLYCVPATIHLAGAEIELVSLVAREQRLRTALDLFLSEAEEPFHYVFIDCPPSLGLLTINAFVAAREVLIPIQCEYYALEGLSQLLSNIQLIERHLNPRLTVSTILLTMYDGRTNLANQVADDVREHFPREVLDTLIPRSVRISEAPSYGQSVISYDPSSPGSLSYLEAAAEIAKRGAPA